MFEIGYMAFFAILLMLFGAGFFVGRFLTVLSLSEKEPERLICDYRLSKDYERLYQLLNDGNIVLIKSKGIISDKGWFYNAWKAHSSRHKNEYYLGAGNSEEIETLEKFILYCKFKDIEFLDFIY